MPRIRTPRLPSALPSPAAALPSVRAVTRWRVARGKAATVAQPDEVVVEEPLEIRIDDRPFAVVMRTPGDDLDLVRGLLLAEGLLAADGPPAAMVRCHAGRDDAARGNVIAVTRPAGAPRVRRITRNLAASSACGVCGRTTIADLARRAPPVASDLVIDPRWLLELPRALSTRQEAFARTGGLHAAALCVVHRGALRAIAVREDIGRHNAVDKVIGAALRARLLPLAQCVLFVSGRAGFEIVQKARVAGIPIVAAVSAPSSLAIELAEAGGQTLVAFLRGDRFNVYCGAARLQRRPAEPSLARARKPRAPVAARATGSRALASPPRATTGRRRSDPRDKGAAAR
ncbi:MAG: formate dehydrogenase accessory sulfurtransferase FdhD [Planctomycetes bacterium]|nr:formate dehydrogenase accessory sulfurtransferase FdhD [Planctomycetota bacterium]